jgi:hypothetical protein
MLLNCYLFNFVKNTIRVFYYLKDGIKFYFYKLNPGIKITKFKLNNLVLTLSTRPSQLENCWNKTINI